MFAAAVALSTESVLVGASVFAFAAPSTSLRLGLCIEESTASVAVAFPLLKDEVEGKKRQSLAQRPQSPHAQLLRAPNCRLPLRANAPPAKTRSVGAGPVFTAKRLQTKPLTLSRTSPHVLAVPVIWNTMSWISFGSSCMNAAIFSLGDNDSSWAPSPSVPCPHHSSPPPFHPRHQVEYPWAFVFQRDLVLEVPLLPVLPIEVSHPFEALLRQVPGASSAVTVGTASAAFLVGSDRPPKPGWRPPPRAAEQESQQLKPCAHQQPPAPLPCTTHSNTRTCTFSHALEAMRLQERHVKPTYFPLSLSISFSVSLSLSLSVTLSILFLVSEKQEMRDVGNRENDTKRKEETKSS